MDPEVGRLGGSLAYRDGRTMAQRNDGQPTFKPTGDTVIKDVLSGAGQGKVTPYDLLASAFRSKRARLKENATAEAAWKGAISQLADLYMASRSVGTNSYKFQSPRIRSIEMAGVDFLRSRVIDHTQKGDLKTWVGTGLLADLQSTLTGPIAAGALDLTATIQANASTDARGALFALLAAHLTDPGPTAPDAARFRGTLSLTADLLQLLLDDGDVVPIVRKLAPLLDPANGAVDGGGAVLTRSLPADPNQVLIQLARNYLKADVTGLYPAYRVGDILNEIHRARAGEAGVYGSTLTEADMASILQGLGLFLVDPMRGAVRLVDIVQNRNLPQ